MFCKRRVVSFRASVLTALLYLAHKNLYVTLEFPYSRDEF